jgi:hypothetical protein
MRVVHTIKAFLAHGFEQPPDRPHLGQRSALTPALETEMCQEVRQSQQGWGLAQMPDGVAGHFAVSFTPDDLARRRKLFRIPDQPT